MSWWPVLTGLDADVEFMRTDLFVITIATKE